MKSKELIALIQKADPSGEIHCCVSNVDIFTVDRFPAYYDGHRQELIRDESKKPYFDVVAGKITGKGEKIVIRTLTIEELIWDLSEAPVELEDVGKYSEKEYNKQIEQWRKEAISFKKQSSNNFLVEVLNEYKQGWKVVQDKSTNPQNYCGKKWIKDGQISEKGICQGEAEVLIESGFFKSAEKENLIVWETDI